MRPAEVRPAVPEPAVVGWYRLYCVVLVFLLAIVAPVLLWGAASASPYSATLSAVPEVQQMVRDGAEMRRLAMTPWIFLCLFAAILPGVALGLKPSPDAWVYHVVVLALGLSGCTLPFSVILLILWFQPATQAYFGRGTSGGHAA